VVKFNPHDAVPMVVEPEKVNKWKWWFYGVLSVLGVIVGLFFMAAIAFSGI